MRKNCIKRALSLKRPFISSTRSTRRSEMRRKSFGRCLTCRPKAGTSSLKPCRFLSSLWTSRLRLAIATERTPGSATQKPIRLTRRRLRRRRTSETLPKSSGHSCRLPKKFRRSMGSPVRQLRMPGSGRSSSPSRRSLMPLPLRSSRKKTSGR